MGPRSLNPALAEGNPALAKGNQGLEQHETMPRFPVGFHR